MRGKKGGKHSYLLSHIDKHIICRQIAGAHYLPSLAATLALSRNNLITIRNVMMRVILLRGVETTN